MIKSKVWLACSRALGDIEHKKPTVLVSAEPDVKVRGRLTRIFEGKSERGCSFIRRAIPSAACAAGRG